ncbi:MAG: IS1595 family transposase [Patescibacteria group bacterium]
MKYTIKDFNREFPNEDTCLDYIFTKRFGLKMVCPHCAKYGKFHRVSGRKMYSCAWCGHQIAPLADTIFHKSSTPLTLWFYALFLVSQSKNGVSAKELERQLGVTYKTAWRMAKQIRKLMSQEGNDTLKGVVEADETYIGGRMKRSQGGKNDNKTPVFGMVERKGQIRAQAVGNAKASTLLPIMRKSVRLGTCVVTDEWKAYNKVKREFRHFVIKHKGGEYVRGDIYTNTIEGFWSQLKRSINGTYHAISPKYLQTYVNEFAYRYNLRFSEQHPFSHLLGNLVKVAPRG